MKPATLLYALGFAELALAMPVPMTISDMVAHVKGEARRLTRVTRVTMHRKRPSLEDSEEGQFQIEFDNTPVSPSNTLAPSLVLAAPRPLKTDYLQALARHPRTKSKDRVVDIVGDGTPETITPMTLEDLLPSKTRMPCWNHVQVPQPTLAIFEQHPDLIVLGAVIALVVVLLVLETVGTTFQGVRNHYSPQEGQIRLEGDEKRHMAPSFRSDSPYDEEPDVERRAS